jgi:hypothetical protein
VERRAPPLTCRQMLIAALQQLALNRRKRIVLSTIDEMDPQAVWRSGMFPQRVGEL